MRLMIAQDAVKAQKRMRNAGITGFVSAGIGLFVALISFSGVDAEGGALISERAFAFIMVESSLMVALAYGILKRVRMAGVFLFFYFLISKAIAFSIGAGNLTALPVQLVFGYLFFQGLRGALTFHYLTRPRPLVAPLAGQTGVGTDPPM